MVSKYNAIARAHSNIAFIKYWGNKNDELRLAANSSISMNLKDLYTTTQVEWSDNISDDVLSINRKQADESARKRVSSHLQLIRDRFNVSKFATVNSINNFPMGTGIASSASSFAALTLAGVEALGESMSEKELSALARRGSGSASRSIPAGIVEWHAGDTDETSYADTFTQSSHWDLVDVIAIISKHHKRTGSSAGHTTAGTSVLQSVRVESAAKRLEDVKDAIVKKDFELFADVVEEDSNLMHAVMMTSRPPLFYWEATSLEIMKTIRDERINNRLQVCYTLDAGPNVHCICIREHAEQVISLLQDISSHIEIRTSSAGEGAHIVQSLNE